MQMLKSLSLQQRFGKLSHLKIALLVSTIVGVFKVTFQYFGIEFLQVNPLLTAIISGNIFILGFLLNSTLRDYKEAEKLPAGMATSLETIFDECEIMLSKKKEPIVTEAVQHLLKTQKLCTAWFYKKAYTQEVLMHISDFNKYLEKFEPLTQANFIVRMKNEQNNLRKQLIQANILRDTPFYEASYSIAKISVFFLLILLTLLSAEPFYEYVFYIIVIVFITIFLVSLIKDLDDPFEYNDADISDEVSLKPLSDFTARTKVRMKKLKIKI
ncbi:MAG: hypothetical protein M3Q81_05320 [bacterium]|nr:hypothetical protein [bacterium]